MFARFSSINYFFRIFSIWRHSSTVLICWGGRVWLISSWSRSFIAAATWRYWRKIGCWWITRIQEVGVVVVLRNLKIVEAHVNILGYDYDLQFSMDFPACLGNDYNICLYSILILTCLLCSKLWCSVNITCLWKLFQKV